MSDRLARVIAPAVLTLFAALGVVMGDRPLPLGTVIAVAVAGLGVVAAWLALEDQPLAVVMLLAAGGMVALGHAGSANLVWMGICLLTGWVALCSSTPVGVGYGVVTMLALLGEWAQQTEEPGWMAWIVGTLFTLVVCHFARRLRETVVDLGAAQHQLAERTRAEERTRIAAEVHDVIGHALTVSLLHITSARLALDEDPEEARAALEEAERLSRQSLDEVRATVGLMRTDGPGETAPLPDATAIPALVDSFRRAGAAVDLTVAGDLPAVGSARGLAAYRVVQEGLTNATKHAPGRPVRVAVHVTDEEVEVTVTNDGTPFGATAPPGAGLRGMSDRVTGLGGRLDAGPVADGWRVEAVLPA